MTKLAPFLFVLFACATQSAQLPTSAAVKTKTFASAKEAKNFVRNKWNYLQILFEQSRDPYYGTPRWPEECLKQHVFGKLQEKGQATYFVSRLLLNSEKAPGDCRGTPADVIYLHCGEESVVREIVCAPDSCRGFLSGKLCP